MADIEDLPEGWEIKTLGEIFIIERGGSPRPIEDYITNEPSGLNWIKIGDTKGITKYITSTKEKIRSEGLKKTRMVYEDDFILSNSMSFGKPFIMKTQGCIHDGWLVIRKNDNVDNNFLYYVLSSNNVFAQFSNLAKGSTVKNLNIEAVKKVKIPLPPLKYQQAIVSKIEELFSELDKGIEDLKLAQQQLKVYRQSVLKQAFEGRLTNQSVKDCELPENWEWVTLGQVCKITNGKNQSKVQDVNGIYPIYGSGGIIGKANDYLCTEGTTIIGRKGTINNPIYVQTKFWNVDTAFGLTPNERMLSKFLYLFCLSFNFNDLDKSTTIPSLAKTDLLQIKLSLPSIKEQNFIIQELEKRLSVADMLEANIVESLEKAELLKQSILKKAFSGELIAKVKPVEVPKIKNKYFHQLQLVALVINGSKKKKIDHGEMTLAKNLYLLDSIYNIPTGFKYDRWHLGPYPPALKKVVNNKGYFTRTDNYIEVQNEEKLLKYNIPLQEQITGAIDDISSIFGKYKGAERSHKTELLATVCKVIEDIKSTDLAAVRESMQEWKIELKNSEFKTKAEKFTEPETRKCIEFIVVRGWDRKLIKNQ